MASQEAMHLRRWPLRALLVLLGAGGVALALGGLRGSLRAEDKAQRGTLLAGCRHRESLLRTIDCFFTVRDYVSEETRPPGYRGDYVRRRPEQGPYVSKYHWATDGTRWRCDGKIVWPADDEGIDAFTQRSFSGEAYYFLDLKEFMGWREAQDRGSLFGRSLFYLLMTDNDRPLSEALADDDVVLVGQEELRGKTCYKLVRRKEDPERGRHTKTYWLLADGSFPMVRFEWETVWADPRPPWIGGRTIVTVEEMADCGEGLLLPKVTKREWYALFEGSKASWQSTDVFSMDEVTVNAELGDELFVLDFPIGSFVHDETGKARYVGGPFNEAEVRVSKPPPCELDPNGPQ